MRRRRLKTLWARLGELQKQQLSRDELLLKLGAARAEAGQAYRLVEVHVAAASETGERLSFSLRKDKLRQAIRHEGHYLLRSNLIGEAPEIL